MHKNMLAKIAMVLSLLLAISRTVAAQEKTGDPAALIGEWQLDKVIIKLFSQTDHRLVGEKVYTPGDSLRKVVGFVPVYASFSKAGCVFKTNSGSDAGTYLVSDSALVFEPGAPPATNTAGSTPQHTRPGMQFFYRQPAVDKLVLRSSGKYYQVPGSGIPVKQVDICFFSRKKN